MIRRWKLAGALLLPAFPALGLPIALLSLVTNWRQAALPAAPALATAALLLVTSSLLGPGGLGSLGVVVTALLVITLALAYGATLARLGEREALPTALLAGGLISAMVALARAPFFEWATGYPRLQGILGQENLLGMQMAATTALLLGGAGRHWPLPVRGAALALLLLVLGLTGTRSAILAVVVAGIIAGLTPLLVPGRRRLAALLLGAVVLTGALAVTGTLGDRFNPVHAVSQGRDLVWQRSLQVFAEHPWTGVGFNQLVSELMPEAGGARPPHAHNFALHLLAEGGVLGGLPLILLLLAAMGVAWSRWPLVRPFLAAFLVTNLVDYNLGSAYVAPMLYFVLGAALAEQRERKAPP